MGLPTVLCRGLGEASAAHKMRGGLAALSLSLLSSRAALCRRRPVPGCSMPAFRICPCLRRRTFTVSPVGRVPEEEKVSAPPESEVRNSSLGSLSRVKRRSFGSFEFCSLDGADGSAKARDDVSGTGGESGDDAGDDVRPLVILIPWLNARESTVSKYGSLYLEKGMDVLLMRLTPMQIIRPLQTKRVVGELLALLQDTKGPLSKRPLLIHGFSIGAFVWGQLLVEMDRLRRSKSDDLGPLLETGRTSAPGSALRRSTSEPALTPLDDVVLDLQGGARAADWVTVDLGGPRASLELGSLHRGSSSSPNVAGGDSSNEDWRKTDEGCAGSSSEPGGATPPDIQSRILGVVMDSPTPYENILEGIPNSISDNSLVRASIRALLSLYMRAFYSTVTTHYIQGAQAAESDNGGLPALMLYSSADRIVSHSKVDTVVDGWRKKGLFVRCRKWEDTPHVGHFRLYPEEYKRELQGFLDHLRLTRSKL